MTKPILVSELSISQLKVLIANHRKKFKSSELLCIDAICELEKRSGKGLDFDKSFAIIRNAARERRFLSYKDLADASGASWAKVHYEVGAHLWRLIEFAHLKGWPMLSAIVVNKPNVGTGSMAPETLKGFVSAARALGHTVTDEVLFLRNQQRLVFAWGEIFQEGGDCRGASTIQLT